MAAGLALLTIWIAARYSLLVAGVFAILAVTNSALMSQSAMVTCECLLCVLLGLAWLLAGSASRAWSNRETAASLLYSALLGACLGLAYLAKGTGPVYLAGALLWTLAWKNGAKKATPDSAPATTRTADERPSSRRLSQFAVAAVVLLVWVAVASANR